jgi:FCP1-like phosphatase family protein
MPGVPCDYRFEIEGIWHYVKFRPYLFRFLERVSRLYEIHIYTMGVRRYAEKICEYLDNDKRLFGDRIVSRCENMERIEKRIDRISSLSSNVVILDDRGDIWNYSRNLILIRPFWFYNVSDINFRDDGRKREKTDECELFGIYRILKRVHRKYFQEGLNTRKTVSLKIFRNIRFVSDERYARLIEWCGGVIDEENPGMAIEWRERARKHRIPNIASRWIYECIYRRRLAGFDNYLLDDYREIGDYGNELEGVFD